MKIIKCLAKAIRCELHCANEYATKALHYKAENKGVADTFYLLANDRLNDIAKLHAQVTAVIAAADSTNVPAVMQSIWDFEHDLMIEEEAEVRTMLAQYK